jgi:hypothetical protein
MIKKWLIALAATLLVTALVFTGVVVAQSPTPQGANPSKPFVDKDGDGVCDYCGRAGMGRCGMWGNMRGAGVGRNGANLVSTIADALDMSVADLLKEVTGGKTLRQVIVAHNGDPAAIINTFVAARKAVLDKQVADGRLTQEQDDSMLANMKAQAEKQLDEANPMPGPGDCGRGAAGRGRGRMGTGGGRGSTRPTVQLAKS